MFVVVGITAMNEVNEPALAYILGTESRSVFPLLWILPPRTGVTLPDPSLVWRRGLAV